MASPKNKIGMLLILAVFVIWLFLLSGFFFSNIDSPASDGYNWALGITTVAGGLLFLGAGLYSIQYS
jgi:hypothetical protein